MLNREQLQRLAHLQIKICTIDERLAHLKMCIKLLLKDKCKVVMFFKLHNDDQCSSNADQRKVDEIMAEPTIFGEGITKTAVPACTIEFRDTLTESVSIRMLDFMYQEESKQKDVLFKEMKSLLFEGIPITKNPILELYSDK